MRRILTSSALVAALLVAGVPACTTAGGSADAEADSEQASGEGASGEAELARYMANLQRWTHKAALALEARNADLADFYLHEVEETVETVQEEAPTYEGYPVGELTGELLVPAVASLDTALDRGEWSAVDRRVEALQQACNECHRATDHGFVRIDLRDLPNPYAQRFDTASAP